MEKQDKGAVKFVAGSMKNKVTATELVLEREKCEINKDQVCNFLFGDKEFLADTKKVIKEMKDDPMLANNHHFYEMTVKEKRIHQYKKLNHIWNTYPDRRKEFFGGYEKPNKCNWYYMA